MILGIGTDIIEIERIRKSIERHSVHFLNRLFTPDEQLYCQSHKDPVPYFAGRFAAKEAVAKALGTGIGKQLSWLDIEIQRATTGQPTVVLASHLKTICQNPKILISISHCKAYAMATAILSEH